MLNEGMALTTHTRNVFAWTDDPLYQYRDLIISGRIAFRTDDANYGAGVLFRKIDDASFYDCIVSSNGRIRFDAVFNGNQIPLIAWTEIPDFHRDSGVELRIIVRGTHFSFYIDDQWIAEIADDTLTSGGVSFAIQNYNDADEVTACLLDFILESRPVEVEAAWYRWTSLIPADTQRRSSLSRTFASMGQFTPAGVQLKKIALRRSLTPDEYLLLATCRLNNGDIERALANVESALESAPGSVEAIAQKANILYLQNRFLDLKTFFALHSEMIAHLPGLWNLSGNCAYALGEWSDSISAYKRAIDTQPDMPLFHANLGRALERTSRFDEAIDAYAEAASLLFREESYEELERILAWLSHLDPEHPQVSSLEGKLAFHDGNFEKAMRKFSHLIESGLADSSVFFLQGIIMTHIGDRNLASDFYKTAIDLDPDVPVYWRRYAENRFLSGQDPTHALSRALELAPGDPWVLNLAGLIDLEEDLPESAVARFRGALEISEGEQEIVANLAEALFQAGEREEAYRLLSDTNTSATCMNQLGRLYAQEERYTEAVEALEKAVQIDAGNRDFQENLAGAYIEADMVHQAEVLLTTLLEFGPTANLYNLMGHVAQAKGEAFRAESAYNAALKLEPENTTIASNLVEHYLRFNNFDLARETWNRLLPEDHSDRTVRLDTRIRSETQIQLTCATCGREWWAPKNIEPQPRLVIKGEPSDETPAGKCATCGKVYCVSCAKHNVREGRFICPTCDEPLKLSDEALKYLVASHVR